MPPEQEKTDDHDGASVLAEVHHDADHKFRALDSCHDCSAANHPRSNRLVGYLSPGRGIVPMAHFAGEKAEVFGFEALDCHCRP